MKHKHVAYILVLLLSMALAGCGREPTLELGEFKAYVEKFESKSGEKARPTKVTDLIVRFGATSHEKEAGVCEIAEDKAPTITINRKIWDRMDEPQREALMNHELGHCVLFRPHKTSVTDDGIPASVMNPYTLAGEIYSENEEYYWHELFHP